MKKSNIIDFLKERTLRRDKAAYTKAERAFYDKARKWVDARLDERLGKGDEK